MGSDRIRPDRQPDLTLCLHNLLDICIMYGDPHLKSHSYIYFGYIHDVYCVVVRTVTGMLRGARISRPFALMDQQQALQLMEEPSL